MSKIEKFGLATGVIGLVADLIGLITFLAGFWQFSSDQSTTTQMPFIFQALMGLSIFYGWFVISWVLVRRNFVMRDTKHHVDLPTMSTVGGVGFLIFPIFVCWLVVIAQSLIVQSPSQIKEQAIIEATKLPQMALLPTITTQLGTPAPTPITIRTVEEIIALKESEQSINIFSFLIFFSALPYILIAVMMAGTLQELLPVIYPDMIKPNGKGKIQT